MLLLSHLLICAALLFISSQCIASPRQDITTIKEIVRQFVQIQTAGLPGQVAVIVGSIDQRLVLPLCPELKVFVPAGGRLWGRTTVGVRCDDKWTVYVPVDVKVNGNVVITTRQLPQKHTISESDIATQVMDLTKLTGSFLTELAQALGKTTMNGIASGQPLRNEMLRSPIAIEYGQTVRLIVQGQGFKISSEAKAIGQATEGQTIKVRTPSGQIVTGTARSSTVVEVAR